MPKRFEEKFEFTLDFLKNSNMCSPNKPALPHVNRVGKYLYEKGFSDDIVNAGLLHDSLEWSETTESELEERFGSKVLAIVKANSKNKNIEGTMNRAEDMITRCREVGDDALAVKIADVVDSCCYYAELKNERGERELVNYKKFVKLLLDNLSDNLRGIFVNDLKSILFNS